VKWGTIQQRSNEHAAAAGAEHLPGEFVSEDMRADCARFLDELRAQISHRYEEAGEGPAGPFPTELEDA
jgi:hypothetical protein